MLERDMNPKPPPFAERNPKQQLAELTRPRGGSVRSAGGGRVELSLPLPPNSVSKNCRNWRAKAAATKAARIEACQAALIARVQGAIWNSWWGATATVRFFVKDNRRRDPSNLMDRLHPYWDGIQSAGLIQDDSRLLPNVFAEPEVSGEPRVEIVLLERVKPLTEGAER